MLRGVWQALNCLSNHATHCVIIAGASPGETKMWAAVRENSDFSLFRLTHWLKHHITRKLLKIDTCCEGFGKHWIVFSFIERFAWLPQGRPQGKQKMKAAVRKNGDFYHAMLCIRYMPSCCLSVRLVFFTDIKHFAKDTMSAILFPVHRSTKSNCAD